MPLPLRRVSRALVLASQLLLLHAVGAWAQPAAYQGPTFEDPALTALELTPRWRAPLDSPTAALLDDALFYLSGGSLVAADVASGAERWRFGTALTGPVAAGAGLVLVGGEALTALRAADGSVAWRYQSAGLSVRTIGWLDAGLVVSGNYDEGGAVLDLDGSLRFRIQVFGAGGPLLAEEGVLFWQASYGEPHFENVIAFDLHSGAELWRAGRSAGPLAVREGRAYLLEADWSKRLQHAPSSQEVVVVDARLGTELERWEYRSVERGGYLPAGPERLFIHGERLYVIRSNGAEVAEFPLGGAAAPLRTFAPSYHQGRYRLGPVGGLFLFETDLHELRGVTLPAGAGVGGAATGPGSDIGYAGPGSPISRLELHGGTLYLGRTDGLLFAIDVDSARQRYFVRTGGSGFGPVLEADGRVALQTTGEIVVVETQLPAPGPGAAADVGRVTLVTQYGTGEANADLVAVRSGAAGWRLLQGRAGHYEFEAGDGAYALAILCFEDAMPVVALYQFPANELPYLRHACSGESGLLTERFELHGAVRGLELPPARPWHLFEVALGRAAFSRYLLPADAPSYSLTSGPEAHDLLALRTPAGQAPDRAILLRAVRLGERTRLDLDFLGAAAFDLERRQLRAPEDTLVRAQLRTCNGTVAELVQYPPLPEAPPAPALLYAALPEAERRACDRYELSALATGQEGEFRLAALFLREPADAQLTLPALPAEALMTFATGPGAPRVAASARLQLEWRREPGASIYLFGAELDGFRWQVYRSATLPPALQLPDLAALPGWPPAEGGQPAPSAVSFGAIGSTAGAWQALLAWESVLGYRRFPEAAADGLRLGVALRSVRLEPP